ncbi:MAG: ankyrin repeat domain-containing protein, partial [Kangiellaceae bacterium]|nr:ankyrin repeat domain-containing protein [Kangiellaceae bacterium]
MGKGADPNLCCGDGNTPVYIASASGHSEVLKVLLAYGGRPEVPNQRRAYSLHAAVKNNHCAVTDALLSHNWSLASIQDLSNKTALDYAETPAMR